MRLFFIDEFDGVAEKKNFGISLVSVDATKYRIMCDEFIKILKRHKWDSRTELKGYYLFSRNPAGVTKSPEEMIELEKDLIKAFAGSINTRGGLITSYNALGRSTENYRGLVCRAINKLPRNSHGGIKSLASVIFDRWDQLIAPREKSLVDNEVSACLKDRGYYLVEHSSQYVESSNDTPGIIYADILGHISRWIIENPKSKELNLFDLVEGKPTTSKKVIVAHEIFDLLKKKVII